MFKSQLQEYAQKAALPPPVYEFVKEGAPHEPRFKASVNINGVSYESAPGYPNLKSAEHAAAKVALEQLVQTSGGGGGGRVTPAPVHESGLCKNLLQEYAQKSSLPLPVYRSIRSGEDHSPSFSATVEVAGVKYSGGFAKSKKEAEIKAARTALLAIQTQAPHVGPRPLGSGQGQTSSTLVLSSGSGKKRYRQAGEAADDSARGRKEQRLIIPVPAANKGLGSEKLLEKQLDSRQNLDVRTDGGQDEEGLLPGDSSQPFSQETLGPEAGSSQESCLTQEQQAPNNPSVSGLRQGPAITPAIRGSYSYPYPGYLPSNEAHLHGRRHPGPQHIFSSQQDLPEYSFPDSEGYGHSIIHDYVRTAELAALVPQIQPRLHEVHSNQQECRQTPPQMQGSKLA